MSSAAEIANCLPSRLGYLLDRDWQQVTIGKSDAAIWRISGAAETLFLKIAPIHPLSELPGEAARLAWLAETPIAAPRRRDSFEANGSAELLMTALPGADLTQFLDRPQHVCRTLASGLRAIHGLEPAACPFDHRLDAKLAAGFANAEAGLVDETDFDQSREGWTTPRVVHWLREYRPGDEDLVVCHGDASLPNIMADAFGFVGIVDCGRLGVADRWQDLAIACRSIIFNCGHRHLADFLAAYGAEWDEARYHYYCTLDELF
jgi:aminoglycoside 3'-phosphotransferase-2